MKKKILCIAAMSVGIFDVAVGMPFNQHRDGNPQRGYPNQPQNQTGSAATHAKPSAAVDMGVSINGREVIDLINQGKYEEAYNALKNGRRDGGQTYRATGKDSIAWDQLGTTDESGRFWPLSGCANLSAACDFIFTVNSWEKIGLSDGRRSPTYVFQVLLWFLGEIGRPHNDTDKNKAIQAVQHIARIAAGALQPNANLHDGVPPALGEPSAPQISQPAPDSDIITVVGDKFDYDTLIKAYNQVFDEDIDVLFANIDNPENTDAIVTLASFIIGEIYVSTWIDILDRNKKFIDAVDTIAGFITSKEATRLKDRISNANKGLLDIAYAKHFMTPPDEAHARIKGVGKTAKIRLLAGSKFDVKFDNWIPYGIIAKILNHKRLSIPTENREEFPSCELKGSNKFHPEDAATYRKELKVVNELVKAGLIDDIEKILIPPQNSQILFETLKLNDKVTSVKFVGESEPFKLSEALTILEPSNKLETLLVHNAVLGDEAKFFNFINQKERNIKYLKWSWHYGDHPDFSPLIETAKKILKNCNKSIIITFFVFSGTPLSQEEINDLVAYARGCLNWKGMIEIIYSDRVFNNANLNNANRPPDNVCIKPTVRERSRKKALF